MSDINKQQADTFIKLLYKPTENVITCGPTPNVVAYNGNAASAQVCEYITLNPVLEQRQSSNMADYRNFLIEMDGVELSLQMELLQQLMQHVPLRAITFSGRASYHAVISLGDTLINAGDGEAKAELYKSYARNFISATNAFFNKVQKLSGKCLVDKSNIDAARLTRMAGAVNRMWKYPGTPHALQTLEYSGTLCTSEQFIAFISEYSCESESRQSGTPAIYGDVRYSGHFASMLANQSHLKGLHRVLNLPETWAGPAGNHSKILSYTLWAIDATGVTMEDFYKYFMQHTAPYIKSLGYDENKFYDTISGAYEFKKMKTSKQRK